MMREDREEYSEVASKNGLISYLSGSFSTLGDSKNGLISNLSGSFSTLGAPNKDFQPGEK